MQTNAEERPTAPELWADPWLQNFNPAGDQSLVSYSSRQSYSTRGGSHYAQAASARYGKTSSNPFYSPNPRSGYGGNRADAYNARASGGGGHTRGSNDSRATSPKNGQTINNNINIINNITQITYHTNAANEGAPKKERGVATSEAAAPAQPTLGSNANLHSNAHLAGAANQAREDNANSQIVIDPETLENMVNLGLSRDDVEKRLKQYMATSQPAFPNFDPQQPG